MQVGTFESRLAAAGVSVEVIDSSVGLRKPVTDHAQFYGGVIFIYRL